MSERWEQTSKRTSERSIPYVLILGFSKPLCIVDLNLGVPITTGTVSFVTNRYQAQFYHIPPVLSIASPTAAATGTCA